MSISNNPSQPARREFESLQHAAARLDCTVHTLREKIKDGTLPAYRFSDKPGSGIRVRVADVDEMLKPFVPQGIFPAAAKAGVA